MLETPHVIVGAVIAIKVVNPALSLPLAFASHFILERVPHWNPHLNTEKNKLGKITKRSIQIVILDSSLALLGGFYLASRMLPDVNKFTIVLLACFLSSLPDLVEAPYFFLNIKSRWINKWIALQKSIQVDTSILPGILTQIVTILAAFWWLKA